MAALGRALVTWGAANRRAFPWRETGDPWAVLVSEVMLQQTSTGRVVVPYRRFLERFPTPAECAAAGVGDVVRAWSGLGYNRRAVRLHQAATAIVVDHGGAVPDELAALLALPGIGPYTARAVLAFAFARDTGVVDTNAGRVLARLVAGRPLTPVVAQALADALVPTGRGRELGYALFDLGATLCTSRRPACERCSLADRCAWGRRGHAPPDPARASAGWRRPQPTFAGSERQGRGRLVEALRSGPLPSGDAAAVTGWEDPVRTARAVEALVDEGLVRRLPGDRLALS